MVIKDLLKFDDEKLCENSFYKNFHVWFFIRCSVFTKIIFDELELEIVDNSLKDIIKHKSILKKIKYILLTIIKKIPVKKENVIFFSSNEVNIKSGNYYENRLYDFFYNQLKSESIIVEDSFNLEYMTPRKENVYYSDYIRWLNRIYCFFIKKNKDDYIVLSSLVDNIKTLFEDFSFSDEYWENLKDIVYDGFRSFQFKKRFYLKMLKKIKPKIVFRENASYGGYQALAYACNVLHISYAEFQHGGISDRHVAYNYGKSFFESERLKKLLPSYYLTFGNFWGSLIRHPAKKYPIGFPYLQQKYNIQMQKKIILIVSDGTAPNQNKLIISYVKDFALENDLHIILKLHPCEALKINQWYFDLLNVKNLSIRLNESVYDYICQAKFVIGCYSTVMYETLCFGLNPFVYESKVNCNSIFTSDFDTFRTKDELLDLMNGEKKLKKIDTGKFFSNNWKTAFSDFINGL